MILELMSATNAGLRTARFCHITTIALSALLYPRCTLAELTTLSRAPARVGSITSFVKAFRRRGPAARCGRLVGHMVQTPPSKMAASLSPSWNQAVPVWQDAPANDSKCPNNNMIADGAVLYSAPFGQLIAAVLGAQLSLLTAGTSVGRVCRSTHPRICDAQGMG
jgi:hypothetical protein